MILKVSLLVVGLFAGAALSVSIDCDIEQCAKPSKLYEELGCKAVFGSRSCCAKRFECPDFKKLDDNKCTFEGKEYKIGEILPRTLASNTKCVETCFCTRQNNEPAKFTCKNSDCGISSLNAPGCLNIYGDLNECCSTSIVCDEAEKETLASCYVGREYREGEKFIPQSNPCYECLCHKDFDNTTITDNPHCRKLNCGIDLRYKSFVQRGCLPVFHSETCCPVNWECPTKPVKKVIKRSADDDETQTAKQNVFIVTPSKNLEEYLAEVKLANEDNLSTEDSVTTSTSATTTTTEAPPKVISTEPTSIPTLSSDPFLLPIDEITTVTTKVEEETTPLPKASIESESSTSNAETTQALTTSAETSTTPVPTTETSEKVAETSEPATGPPTFKTTQVTTYESTIASTTIESSRSGKADSDESKESGEEENTNLFGEDVEKDEKVPETTVSSVAESANEVSTTSIETTQPPLTTETITEAVKVLEQPEELTTLAPETTTVKVAPETTLTPETTSEAATGTLTSEATSTTTTQQTSTVVVLPTQELSAQTTPSEIPSTPAVTQEPTTQGTPTTVATISDNVFPTEFEKLLTTLREFVAQADSLTSTSAPSTSATNTEVTKVDQQVESVNFSVSTEKQNEETKSISKRSVRDADLIPAYYKQHLLSSKEKVCVYNGRSFKVGEVIRTDNECLKCLCEYAPIGHCILKEKCNQN